MKDIAFAVEDCKASHEWAVSRGAKSVLAPVEMKDEFETVIMATIQTYDDTVHSLVQWVDYTGPFLPGFWPATLSEPFNELIERPKALRIDHIAHNMMDMDMEPTAEWYEKMLEFH